MSLDELIIDPLERAFDRVGAMDGELAPLKRAAIGGAIGYGVARVFMPDVAYTADGKAKLWSVTAPADATNTTYFPEWMFAAIPAFVASVLI